MHALIGVSSCFECCFRLSSSLRTTAKLEDRAAAALLSIKAEREKRGAVAT